MPHKDPEAGKAYQNKYYRKNRERRLAEARAYRLANPEKVAAGQKACYDRIKDDPEFKAKRSEYGKVRRRTNKDHVKAIERRSNLKHSEKRRTAQRARYGSDKTKARASVGKAVRTGKLPRVYSLSCIKCGEPAREYHHPSYDKEKWLEVDAVCHICHKAIHNGVH